MLSMLLTVALLVTLVPTAWMGTAEAASGTYFIFPGENYDQNTSSRVVNTDRVTLTGSINGVIGNSITYSVFQLSKTANGYTVVNSSEGIATGIDVSGSSIKVTDIKLFSGLNRITFQSKQNSSQIQDSIYIEYRNGPMLYDLKAALGNKAAVELSETKPAVLMGDGSTSDKIIITGKAPNADKVVVLVDDNGKTNSWTYTTSSYNDYKFTASNIPVKPGKNLITIRVYNGDQMVETTREVTYYNGKATFYDTFLQQGTQAASADLSSSPDYSVTGAGNGIKMTGKVLIPVTGTVTNPAVTIDYQFSSGATGTGSVNASNVTVSPNNDYLVAEYSIDVPVTGNIYNQTRVQLEANTTIDPNSAPVKSDAKIFYFTLRNASEPYIYQVNYLSGYSAQTTPEQAFNLTGSATAGVSTNVSSLPAGFEIIVVNGTDSTTIQTPAGTTMKNVDSRYENKTINGATVRVKRFIVALEQLASEGSQTINFDLSPGTGSPVSVKLNLLYGPYVKFDTLYDGQNIPLDTSRATDDKKLEAVGYFAGQLFNIANPAKDIVYTDGATRTVYLYINNVLVNLEKNGSDNTKFKLASGDNAKAAKALTTGVNEIKFVYKSGTNAYEKTVKVNITQTNVPTIPVLDDKGVIPYSVVDKLGITPDYDEIAPKKADPSFVGSNGVYSTSNKAMNVIGTFDFVDLGGKNNVETELGLLSGKDNYILEIKSSNPKFDEINWTLNDKFFSDDNSKKEYNSNGKSYDNLIVYYHPDGQYFSFILRNQAIPQDGSNLVYNFTLYNNGKGGPSATYRLQITGQSTSFDVLRPLPEKRLVNQNFVEVVVDAGNADSVVVNKIQAEKASFDADFDGKYDGENDKTSVWKAIVTDLKPNKETKIDITATVGDEKLKQTIKVTYVPTNIPGAQYMSTMKNSLKIFDGAVQLKFAKGTSLIRRDYDQPQQFKNQVFSGHNLYFAIANSEDGVVDRHEFEIDMNQVDIDDLVSQGAQYFSSRNFPERFSKTSPVYWIDAGAADNIDTEEYDPVKYGADPYQLSDRSETANNLVKNFFWRNPENELVPSKRATLTLKYDDNVAQEAGKQVTAFHFDPDIRQWQNVGGIVDAKKHTIEVPFDRFGYYVVAKLGENYQDVISHPYARDHIEAIYAKGVMNPIDPLQRFGPDVNITRGEFTAMIVKGLQIPLNYSGTKHFDDVPDSLANVNTDNLWDFRYIETAARAGIVKGSQPRVFEPDNVITRQDAAVIIAKALNMKLETDRTKIQKGLTKYFKDTSNIDYYAQASILAIAKKGFINGSPLDPNDPKKGAMFNPKSLMLRGDAAIIMAKIMVDQKKLPKM
ncbi:S-layer homology domain-containing protein [Paenibacillus terreus]|uniref:S-layer homology domain-containing protein n=1 Tax=Paenibacillus terreus TaxID=1387834 RepID=A0ABV5B8W6_9BACL